MPFGPLGPWQGPSPARGPRYCSPDGPQIPPQFTFVKNGVEVEVFPFPYFLILLLQSHYFCVNLFQIQNGFLFNGFQVHTLALPERDGQKLEVS